LEIRRKPQAFAADAVIAMDFQSQVADIEWLGTLRRKATIALFPRPYSVIMAHCSIRGACGFVLVRHPSFTRILGGERSYVCSCELAFEREVFHKELL
jgi:hypothetical protein